MKCTHENMRHGRCTGCGRTEAQLGRERLQSEDAADRIVARARAKVRIRTR